MEYLDRNPVLKKAKHPINVSMKTDYYTYDIIAIKEVEEDTLFEKLDEILGIEGLDWNDTVNIIATYLHYPIEELFYKEPILEKGSGVIDKNYFLGKITELVDEIRYIKREQQNTFGQMLKGIRND